MISQRSRGFSVQNLSQKFRLMFRWLMPILLLFVLESNALAESCIGPDWLNKDNPCTCPNGKYKHPFGNMSGAFQCYSFPYIPPTQNPPKQKPALPQNQELEVSRRATESRPTRKPGASDSSASELPRGPIGPRIHKGGLIGGSVGAVLGIGAISAGLLVGSAKIGAGAAAFVEGLGLTVAGIAMGTFAAGLIILGISAFIIYASVSWQ